MIVYFSLYLFSLATFLVPVVLALTILARNQTPLAKKFILLNMGFFFFVLTLALSYGLLAAFPRDAVAIELLLDSVFFLLYALILIWFTMFVFELAQWSWSGPFGQVAKVLSLSSALFLFIVSVQDATSEQRMLLLRFFLNSIYFFLFLTWNVGILVVAWMRRKRITDSWKRQTIVGTVLILLGGVPLMVVDALWPMFQLRLGILPRGVNMHVLVFIAWNVYFTVQWQRFFVASQDPKISVMPWPRQDNKGLENLTARESEVLSLMLLGKTNLQISETLEISAGTTRNHIYHIYNKVGASSRKEIRKMLAPLVE